MGSEKKLLAAGLLLFLLLASCSPRLQKRERPAPPSPPIRVLLAEIASVDSLEFSGLYHLQTEEARYAFGRQAPKVFFRVDSSGFRIYNNKRFFQFRTTHRVSFNPAEPSSGIRYRGKSYAGRIALVYKNRKLLLIEQLPLEKYIAGVVPAEIFTNKSEWFEAVKAQAVCARTYAYKKMKSRQNADFDVYSDVRDQAYGGTGRQTLLGNKATEQTRGSVLYYKDSLAHTYFHACDGGVSEAVEDVWGQKNRPYLNSRQDVLNDSFSCRTSPVFRWRQTRSMAQLDSAYAFMFGHGFSDSTVSDTTRIALSLRVASRTPSGRGIQQVHVVIACMSHETNTFSPVITDLARFAGGRSVPLAGSDAEQVYTGTATCVGGFLRAAAERGATVSMPIVASAPPSGPVEDDAYEYIAERILAAAEQGPDAILLELHGAMVTRSHEDGEGELLRRLRQVAPDIPLGVSLDMHANVYPDMVACSTVISGYQTYPHIDMDEAALKAGRITLAALSGEVHPVMVWGNVPMLPHVMRQGTDDFPNRDLQARAREMESQGALSVSLFTGFPHADIRNAGLSVVVVTDGDRALAERYRDELLDRAWEHREAFVYQPEPLADSVGRARALAESAEGPVLLLDHYDNTASGGTMDTTEVLAEILSQGLEDVAVFGLYDPGAVAEMEKAGVGSEVTVSLGGKLPMPALAESSRPMELTGRVKLLSDGRFPATVAMSRGLTMNMGLTAVLSVGSVDIVVVSRHIEPFDPGCFRSLGIEPTERRYLMLKSRIHYRVGFAPLVAQVVECAGRGVCTSDYSELTFEHVRRPIYPLDGINSRDGL